MQRWELVLVPVVLLLMVLPRGWSSLEEVLVRLLVARVVGVLETDGIPLVAADVCASAAFFVLGPVCVALGNWSVVGLWQAMLSPVAVGLVDDVVLVPLVVVLLGPCLLSGPCLPLVSVGVLMTFVDFVALVTLGRILEGGLQYHHRWRTVWRMRGHRLSIVSKIPHLVLMLVQRLLIRGWRILKKLFEDIRKLLHSVFHCCDGLLHLVDRILEACNL